MTNTTHRTDLNVPWTLHFDRDGTEDFGIICDAEGNDLVVSHLPSSKVARIADRPFGTGCFWLPEEEDEEMPLLVRQMKLMTTAPKLLEALHYLLEQTVDMDIKYDIGLTEGEQDARQKALAAIAEAGEMAPTKEPHAPPVPADQIDINALLTERKQIAAIWSVEDVQQERPDLTDDQAWEVLKNVDRHQDCDSGITWETVRYSADELFPKPDDAAS